MARKPRARRSLAAALLRAMRSATLVRGRLLIASSKHATSTRIVFTSLGAKVRANVARSVESVVGGTAKVIVVR